MAQDFWTAERTDALKGLIDRRGYSYAQIAGMLSNQFGVPVSRNACLGKTKRLGLIHVRPPAEPRVRIPKVRVPTLRIVRAAGNTSSLKIIETTELQGGPQLRCIEIEPLHIPLEALPDKACHYPFGDGPFTYCGHPALSGSPYCAPHKAICFKPATVEYQAPLAALAGAL
jgi:hypothetical protein